MGAVLRGALLVAMTLLVQGCFLLDIAPPLQPLNDLWTRWMLAGHYGVWKDGKEVPWTAISSRPRPDEIDSYPEGAYLTKYGVYISETRSHGAGWWLTGGLIGRVKLSRLTVELFGKQLARAHGGILTSGFVEGQDYTYEFFLVVRPQATGQGRLVKQWRFPPGELALTEGRIDPAIFRRSTRSRADLEGILNPAPGERRRHFVDGYLDFDPGTKTATVTITGLTRPFQERVDLSAALRP